jgi:hypothetical protein
MKAVKRYPLAALIEASGLSEAALGRLVGMSGTTLTTARRIGLIEAAADRYAIRAGLHPFLVWQDWLEDLTVPCAECERPFIPRTRRHRFCMTACKNRQQNRNWYRMRYSTDPQFAEAERVRRAAAYVECAEYEKARERRRRAAKRTVA